MQKAKKRQNKQYVLERVSSKTNTNPFTIRLPNQVAGYLLSSVIEVCEMQYGTKSTTVSYSVNPDEILLTVTPVKTVADQVGEITKLLEENSSLCLDSKEDRETLIETLLLSGYQVNFEEATLQ